MPFPDCFDQNNLENFLLSISFCCHCGWFREERSNHFSEHQNISQDTEMPFSNLHFPCMVKKPKMYGSGFPSQLVSCLKTGHGLWLFLLEGFSLSSQGSLSQKSWVPGPSLCWGAGSELQSTFQDTQKSARDCIWYSDMPGVPPAWNRDGWTSL